MESPRVAGLQAVLHYALPENGGTTARNHALYQLALDYQRGPYRIGYAGLQASPNNVTATVREKIRYHNVYDDYHYGRGMLYAGFACSNNSTGNTNGRNAALILSYVGNPNNYFPGTDINATRYYNIWQLSADYKISPRLKVGVLYGAIHDTTGGDAGARGGNIGGLYDLSKRTTFYTYASYMKNQANARFRFSGSAEPSANLAGNDINGRSLTGLQAGVVHRF